MEVQCGPWGPGQVLCNLGRAVRVGEGGDVGWLLLTWRYLPGHQSTLISCGVVARLNNTLMENYALICPLKIATDIPRMGHCGQ